MITFLPLYILLYNDYNTQPSSAPHCHHRTHRRLTWRLDPTDTPIANQVVGRVQLTDLWLRTRVADTRVIVQVTTLSGVEGWTHARGGVQVRLERDSSREKRKMIVSNAF